LIAIQRLLGWNNGGVYKRIDEGRELLRLLQIKAPNFLNEHPWVGGWLESTDEFLLSLSKVTSIQSACFPPRADFPRNHETPPNAE